MDYDNNDCIVFSDEEKLMNFLKNKIVEIEIVNKNNEPRYYYDLKKITNSLTKSIEHIMKYDTDIYIFKHMIISISNLNEQHILIIWKTTSSYGFIENDDLDENNLILKIDFRTILKENDKLFMKMDWFEFLENNVSIDCNKNNLIDSIMQYIFNYATYLKINNIKLDMDGIITKGYIDKYMKNIDNNINEEHNNIKKNASTQTFFNENELVDKNESIDENESVDNSNLKYDEEIDYTKVYDGNNVYFDKDDADNDDDFVMIVPQK